MRKKLFLIVILNLLICNFIFAQSPVRSKKSFNNNWYFILDSINNYSSPLISHTDWRKLSLPHDWSIEGSFSSTHPATPGGGALPGGMGWYRKKFVVPESEKAKMIYITFDGVYQNSEVFINGYSLGVRPNGYVTFQYDLTPYLKYGSDSNVIVVKVDNLRQPNSRWYSGSGIYRNVWLTTVSKIHVPQWGSFITTPLVKPTLSVVRVATRIVNHADTSAAVEVHTTIRNEQGNKVAFEVNKLTINPATSTSDSGVSVIQNFDVNFPKLWSIERPYLYKATSEVVIDGKVTDTYSTDFGIRSFRFDTDKGFYLNDKSVKIMGVCNHHDLGALGAAINTRALQRQLELLKEMGCNGIRTSHNPPAPELLELCDKMGFIVMDESFDMWAKNKSPFDYAAHWDKWHEQDLRDHILRDRNHPSVFVWSVGNEIPEQYGDAAKGDTTGRIIARELVNIVQSIDPTRPITTANNEPGQWNNLIQSGAFNLIGYNYHHEVWDDFPKDWPNKKLIVTESTSALATRGEYELVPFDSLRRWPKRWDLPFENPNGTHKVSAYDNVSTPWGSTHEESLRVLLKHNFISGMYVWTGFDYLGEPTPYSWPARSSYFGIFDMAGFPKDAYYLYKSIFTTDPVLHIYPHWNWQAGDTVDIVGYYNNATEVELFLNDSSLGRRTKVDDTLHVKWRVPYQPGTLKAVSTFNGKVVKTKEVKTAGEPAAILLSADRKLIRADGKDLSFITAKIVDKNGVMVPNANHLIHFDLSGQGFIAGVDSGDPLSHESFKANHHTAMNGLLLAIVQSNGQPGKIELKASAENLKSATIILQAK